MKPCYIHSAVSITAQSTFNNTSFLEDVIMHTDNIIKAVQPNYRDFINPSASRRMATGVKMGVVAAKTALKSTSTESLQAIIVGTGIGCIEDSEKFLNTIITNNEEYLTPTSFIQSTHNTVAAQIALGLKCKAYNMTYVHGANSFESALLDTQLILQEEEEEEISSVLVGGIDELGKYFIQHYASIQTEQSVPFSEGAHFFTISNEKENSYASLIGIDCFQTIHLKDINEKANEFLQENEFSINDIDIVILGNNGDDFDTFYHQLQTSLFKNNIQLQYKHLSGEFHTASAFGFWAATQILKTQSIPASLRLNDIQKTTYKTVLLYNQYKGNYHSFTLLTVC
jgi:3-oxoacyl-(acyl-carrier-protein) synthase